MKPKLWTRRRAVQTLALGPSMLMVGCNARKSNLPMQGEIVGANRARGHMLRNPGSAEPREEDWHAIDVVIVGGGIAGLSSGWELKRRGFERFVLLELEDHLGGTSRSGQGSVAAYPWGAHYLPAPMANNRPLIELLDEMGMVSGLDEQGRPLFHEENLCRDPSERLFQDGRWDEELVPKHLSEEEQADWDRFQREVEHWVGWRDEQGRRAFGLPIASCSDSLQVRQLDGMSMAEWLAEKRLDSELVRWEVEYACRDDYGTTPETTSAWAGLFYFASRVESPGKPSQPFLTWPEGNGRFVRHFASKIESHIQTGKMVVSIAPDPDRAETTKLIVFDAQSETTIGYRAKKVIFASPQFVARHLISGYRSEREQASSQFTYAPWMVANLHLVRRTKDQGLGAAWDNVLYDGRGLGYVMATHQLGKDHGPTVLTYYLPICDRSPIEARKWLEQLSWAESAEIVLADLEQAHPEIRQIVERLDVVHWGHAMIRPVPGFMNSQDRMACQLPFHGIHFANTDLSGVPLMEEAFYHGLRAAQEVLASIGTAS